MRSLRVIGLVVSVVAVSWLTACGGGGGGEAAQSEAAAALPREIVESLGLRKVHSGHLEASLFVTKLKEEEGLSLRLIGSFQQLGEGATPQFSLDMTSQGDWNGHLADFNGQLTDFSDKASITYGPTEGEQPYRIETSTLNALGSKLREARAEDGKGNLLACVEAVRGLDFAHLVRHLKAEGRRKEPDDTKVAVMSGEVDVPRLQGLLVRMAQDPDCGAQIEALGLPPAPQLEAARVDFKKGFGPQLTLAVDQRGVIRQLSTRFECARLDGELFELQLDFNLQEPAGVIESPAVGGGEPLEKLLRQFGTTQDAALTASGEELVIALLEGIGGGLSGHLP
jgi:hypothetical protein